MAMRVGEGDHGIVLIDCGMQPILGPSNVTGVHQLYMYQYRAMALREACAAPVDGSQPEGQSSHLHPDRRVDVVS